MLDFFGVELSTDQPAAKPFILWRCNLKPYQLFIQVASHGQWLRAGMDGTIVGLDGHYLLDFLKLSEPRKTIPALLDDIYCLVDGWLDAHREKTKT